MKGKLPSFILIVNLLLLDAAVGFLVYKTLFVQSQSTAENLALSPQTLNVGQEVCNHKCLEYIDQRLSEQINVQPSSTPTPNPTPTKATTSAPKEKVKGVSYVPIPGSGSTLQTSWMALAGTDFYLSKSDFPGLTEVYFEANVKLVNGNGAAYVRIFDVTHGIAVVGSEVQTSSQTSVFLSSGKISLWEGFNHYQVQAKSLTADTAVYESGRLKMVSEN